MMDSPVLLHLHIPKTGGSSLVRFLAKRYGDRFFHVPNKRPSNYFETTDLSNFWCISGHFNFGVHKYINRQPVKYLTFFRNPIDRLLSLYHYFTYNAAVPRPELEKIGFERFVFGDFGDRETEMEIRHFVDNDMVRRISGLGKEDRKVNEDDLYQAIVNLEDYFAPVGLVERFSESINRWTTDFHWGGGRVEHLLHQPDRLKREDLSQDLINRIMVNHYYDYLLYDYALVRDWKDDIQITV